MGARRAGHKGRKKCFLKKSARPSPISNKRASRKKVGPGDGDVVEEMRYTSTIRLRLRKKDSASEMLERRTVLCVLLHEMAHLRHMNHGKKFMLVLRDLFVRAAELGLITSETSQS